jgi:hypothetical protein
MTKGNPWIFPPYLHNTSFDLDQAGFQCLKVLAEVGKHNSRNGEISQRLMRQSRAGLAQGPVSFESQSSEIVQFRECELKIARLSALLRFWRPFYFEVHSDCIVAWGVGRETSLAIVCDRSYCCDLFVGGIRGRHARACENTRGSSDRSLQLDRLPCRHLPRPRGPDGAQRNSRTRFDTW